MDDLSFFDYSCPFCFLSIELHCSIPFDINDHILFIIIVFRLGSDKLVSFLLVFPKRGVTGCDSSLGGCGRFFIFDYSRPFCFLLIEIHYTFSISE